MATAVASWIPSIPYPPSQDGRWSPVTSTLNWCEEDYYMTVYSAEIVNTLTNLLFMYLAGKGIHNCLTNGHDTVFTVAFIGYLIVGTGSFLFHATLKYPMQLVDELSMIYTTCLMFYATFSYGKSKLYSITLGVALVVMALSITLYYHYLQDPTFHQTAYAVLTAIVLFRAIYVMEVNIRPAFRTKEREDANPRSGVLGEAAQNREDARDREILRQMWVLIAWGLSIFLGGFAFWQLDNAFCFTLRSWRRQLGMPWGFLLEGHGWWHLMTGIGAYFYIVWGIWLRHCLNYKQDDYELVWPRITVMPLVVKKAKTQANGGRSNDKMKAKKTS
ncbi:alkaline ceramidase-like protein [Aaosphaeria arxii CBS 175.79]|uniref:Alkaline ceramidase-like protein n=1 Tax=Aaosphaeria arxii CBS 175.79 TaxID=1450172 RepID=A0A6A5Y174_9PLEO|nr:alkaline ceramidase-like protein [Aaosphaeria arxii CBS 175.79]KAF2018827.1 alkaline ceramidase-like protein [Aaosphaeria arxii CBS 175.79]